MPEASLMFSLQYWNDRGEAPASGMETWGRCRCIRHSVFKKPQGATLLFDGDVLVATRLTLLPSPTRSSARRWSTLAPSCCRVRPRRWPTICAGKQRSGPRWSATSSSI